MKAIPIFAIIFLLFSACSNQGNNNATADTATAIKETIDTIPDTLCFQRTAGLKHQDTASVRFVIRGNEVTGNFMNVPYEKDSRKGTLKATKEGDIIKGMWLFAQEGMQDTLSVEFKLSGNILLQKDYSIDKKTGREVLSSKSEFKIEYQKIDCSRFPGL